MKLILFLLLFLIFTNNAFANVDRMVYDIRRMADEQEKQNKMLCNYIRLSHPEFEC